MHVAESAALFAPHAPAASPACVQNKRIERHRFGAGKHCILRPAHHRRAPAFSLEVCFRFSKAKL